MHIPSTTSDGEPLSPELALVSPELAERARALLPERPAFPPPRRTTAVVERPRPASSAVLPAPAVPRAQGDALPRQRRCRSGLVAGVFVAGGLTGLLVAVELLPPAGDPRLAASEQRIAWSADPLRTEPARPATRRAVTPPRVSEPWATQGGRRQPPRKARRQPRPAVSIPKVKHSRLPPPVAPGDPSAVTTHTVPATSPRAGGSLERPRMFVWLPARGTSHYDVRFLRNGRLFHSTRVKQPRLTLPHGVEFKPGSYRWTVRPVRSGGVVAAPIVNSMFTIPSR
jgi:hypothetical protein